jgi:hypothetical protein
MKRLVKRLIVKLALIATSLGLVIGLAATPAYASGQNGPFNYDNLLVVYSGINGSGSRINYFYTYAESMRSYGIWYAWSVFGPGGIVVPWHLNYAPAGYPGFAYWTNSYTCYPAGTYYFGWQVYGGPIFIHAMYVSGHC